MEFHLNDLLMASKSPLLRTCYEGSKGAGEAKLQRVCSAEGSVSWIQPDRGCMSE